MTANQMSNQKEEEDVSKVTFDQATRELLKGNLDYYRKYAGYQVEKITKEILDTFKEDSDGKL